MPRMVVCALLLMTHASAISQAPADQDPPVDAPAAAHRDAAPRPVESEQPRISAALALQMRLSEVVFEETLLADALRQLSDTAGVPIVALWSPLEEAGVRRDSPIDFEARNIRLGQVLWLLMNEPGLVGARLAYRADRDMILLATEEFFGRDMVVKVYDIADLLQSRIRRPSIGVARLHRAPIGVVPTVARGAVGVRPITQTYGSGVLLESEDAGGNYRNERQKRIRELIDAITTTVDPESWAVNGGSGTITTFAGKLVVRNSPLVHQKIGKSISETAP